MEELFCKVCDNLLSIEVLNEKVEGEEDGGEKGKESTSIPKLYNICNSCNLQEENKNITGSVFHLNYDLSDIKRDHIVNPYTRYDPTLPKALGIKCPNSNCPSGSKKADIRYIKYDDKNMKYIYICLDCKNGNVEPNLWYI